MIIKNISSLIFWVTIGAILLLIHSCVDPFRPDLEESENVLVVDGLISNMPGPYTVKLNFSSDVYEPIEKAISGAKVTIIEEGGEEEILTEVGSGIYQTAVGGIQGSIGKNYQLKIETATGKTYESVFQKLKAPIEIESIEPVVETRFYQEEEVPEVPGYQFYLNTVNSENEADYLVWFQEGTFKYNADYPLSFLYSGSFMEVASPFEFMTCYSTYNIKEVYTYSTANLASKKIENLPLTFLRADGVPLRIRYSLLVKQYSIDKAAYNFWNSIESQIETIGSLYSAQPFQIRGNISNVTDPDETVLGYFTVAGESQKRIFVDSPPDISFDFPKCFLDAEAFGYTIALTENWPVKVYQDVDGGFYAPDPGCIDCRERGGVLEAPDFWE